MTRATGRLSSVILGTILGILVVEPSEAEWSARTEGPDIFGVTKVVAATEGSDGSLVIQCDDKEGLSIAYIFRKKEFDDVVPTPAELLVQADNAKPLHLAAEVKEWNKNYAGVAADGRAADSIDALQAIRNAHTRINIGVVVGDHKVSASFEVDGSTGAMDSVVAGCKVSPLRHDSPT